MTYVYHSGEWHNAHDEQRTTDDTIDMMENWLKSWDTGHTTVTWNNDYTVVIGWIVEDNENKLGYLYIKINDD